VHLSAVFLWPWVSAGGVCYGYGIGFPWRNSPGSKVATRGCLGVGINAVFSVGAPSWYNCTLSSCLRCYNWHTVAASLSLLSALPEETYEYIFGAASRGPRCGRNACCCSSVNISTFVTMLRRSLGLKICCHIWECARIARNSGRKSGGYWTLRWGSFGCHSLYVFNVISNLLKGYSDTQSGSVGRKVVIMFW
jgi:hypothetical protein